MARNPFRSPGLPGLKRPLPEYTDQNLNSTLPLNTPSTLPSDRQVSPAALAAPKSPALTGSPVQHPELSPRAQRFRRLAGILGAKKSV